MRLALEDDGAIKMDAQDIVAVGVWEHLDSNVHCHSLVSATEAESQWPLEQGNEYWLKLQPRGQFDIGAIESLSKVSRYIAKELYKPHSLDQLFVYKAPPVGRGNRC